MYLENHQNRIDERTSCCDLSAEFSSFFRFRNSFIRFDNSYDDTIQCTCKFFYLKKKIMMEKK